MPLQVPGGIGKTAMGDLWMDDKVDLLRRKLDTVRRIHNNSWQDLRTEDKVCLLMYQLDATKNLLSKLRQEPSVSKELKAWMTQVSGSVLRLCRDIQG